MSTSIFVSTNTLFFHIIRFFVLGGHQRAFMAGLCYTKPKWCGKGCRPAKYNIYLNFFVGLDKTRAVVKVSNSRTIICRAIFKRASRSWYIIYHIWCFGFIGVFSIVWFFKTKVRESHGFSTIIAFLSLIRLNIFNKKASVRLIVLYEETSKLGFRSDVV